MNPEVKNLWTARLRSGQDEQGRGTLNIDGKKCCLGVLCELAVEAGITTKYENYSRQVEYGREAQVNVLPVEVRDWAGLSECCPLVDVDGVYGRPSLAELNDGHSDITPFTFAQIADVIDANF